MKFSKRFCDTGIYIDICDCVSPITGGWLFCLKSSMFKYSLYSCQTFGAVKGLTVVTSDKESCAAPSCLSSAIHRTDLIHYHNASSSVIGGGGRVE